MNTQTSTPAPAETTSEQTLDQIDHLCSDQAFAGEPLTAPTSLESTAILQQVWDYLKWSASALVSWIAILIASSMILGPSIDSIATIVSGRTGFAWYANLISTLGMTAIYGFLYGRERVWQKRLCSSIVMGSLLTVFGSLWILLQPQGNWIVGATSLVAQLLTYAAAFFCGTKMTAGEKVKVEQGTLMKGLSQVGGILSVIAMVLAIKFGTAYLSTMAEGTLHNGKIAPTTQYVDFDDNSFVFDDYKGKVVLVEFWAPWCGPCVAAMPHLCSLQEQYQERDDFAIVSIAVSSPRETAKEVFEKHGCDWKLLFRPTTDRSDNEKENPLAENQSPEFLPKGVPTAYIIDRNGTVIASGIRGSAIDAQLQKLLGGESH